MSRLENLKKKLANMEPVLSTTISNVPWSGIAQKMAAFPIDFVVLDEEHGTLSVESGEEILRVCRLCGLPTIVRIGDAVPNLISKTLDMGADGIMIPRVESLAQVETAIRCARYYPRGRKGCGGFSNLSGEDCGSLEKYNDNRLIFVQVESYEGLRILPEVFERYGDEIASVIVGPYDSSIMIGTPLDITSEPMRKYLKEVFDTCRAAGKSTGVFVDSGSMIPLYRDLGANVYWVGSEISLLCEALSNLCETFKRDAK